MSKTTTRRPVQVGETAPPFSLSAVTREGTIALEDYRGKSPLLLGMLRGVYCPFCRRQIVQLSEIAGKLRELTVETLIVITTPVSRARVYSKYYPMSVPIAADPEMATHHAYGVLRPELTDAHTNWPATINAKDIDVVHAEHAWAELTEPASLSSAFENLNSKDGFEMTEDDLQEQAVTWNQLQGLVLIDKVGIVGWTGIEAAGGFTDLGNLASGPEIVTAAQGLAG